jgi:hypothetical protein
VKLIEREQKKAVPPMTAEQLIVELNRYGRLSLFQYSRDATWSAKVEMRGTNPAITAEVHTGGYKDCHRTLTEALQALLVKVRGDSA